MGRSRARAYPAASMQMLAKSYLAARLIRSGPCLSDWLLPSNSIVAGCGEANNAARCCVYDVAEEATKASPLHQLSQFVDDFKQYGHATGEQELLAVMLPAVNTFVAGVKSSKFVFSNKSAILSSMRRWLLESMLR